MTKQPCLLHHNGTSTGNATANATSAEDTFANTHADALPAPRLFDHEITTMARRFLFYALVLLHLNYIAIVSTTTTVHFYSDASCSSLFATVQTDTDTHDGQCGQFAASINSAISVFVDDGCSGN